MSNSEWAAWVQAVGSVVAIFIAIAIAWWQVAAEKRLRAKEMELRLLDQMNEGYAMRCLLLPGLFSLELMMERFENGETDRFNIPSQLANNSRDLHVLGEAGHKLLISLGDLFDYSDFRSEFQQAITAKGEHHAWKEYFGEQERKTIYGNIRFATNILREMRPPISR